MKKYIATIACICVLAVAGVLLYINLKPAREAPFYINVEDINVNVNESCKVEYTCSFKDAVITMEIEDEEIATLQTEGNEYYVTGLKCGTTTLTLIGRYNTEEIRETAKISVNEYEDSQTASPINLIFSNLQGCTVEEDSLILTTNQPAILTVNSNTAIKTITATANNPSVKVTKMQMISNKTFSIQATTAGQYILKFRINNQTIEYILLVKEG